MLVTIVSYGYMTQLEIEFKTLLTKKQFDDLKNHFKDAKLIKQDNHYFKYSDPKVKVACRLREIGDKCTLTFKQDHPEGRLETNFNNMIKDSNYFIRDDVQSFLKENNFNLEFIPIGNLLTHRYQVIEAHQEICIDENFYNGNVDYELEVESIDDPLSAKKRFIEICTLFNIEAQAPITKFERYLTQKGL